VVVVDVVLGERAALAVFEPFLADLIATNVELPDFVRHAAEALHLALVDSHGVVGVGHLFDFGVGGTDELGDVLFKLLKFQQVKCSHYG
jgi:hypothetical protein